MEHGRDAAAGPAGAPSAGASQAAGPGGGGGGGGGSGAPPGPAPPIFVSWEEKRELSDRKPPRKSSGHTYTVKFFLCDLHGTEYLAATGEDQGDAHYLYENQSTFPFLRANNKADVRMWLEGIIARCKERVGVHTHLVADAVPQDPRHIQLPTFVGHSHEKQELPDGRHRIEWFLLDEHNDAHLAIVGEEKETRDGHYLYRTQGIFDKALPLQVGNQREVERWIDVMVFHGGVAPLGPTGKAPGDSVGGGPTTSGRAHSALVSDTSAHRGGASSRAGHAGRPVQKAGQKHELLKQATANVKKLKSQQAGRPGADPDQEARDVVAAELARWAQEEAQRRESAKKQALAYALDPLAGKEAGTAKRCLATLKQAAAGASFLPPPPGGSGRAGGGGAGSHQQQLNLVETLGALREVGHMYAPLSLVAMPELKECLAQLGQHKHPEVSQLATSVLEQWLRTAVAQAQVLADPRYVQDPRSVLEASLTSRTAMDPIVSAVTHRKLHPPPPPHGYLGYGPPPRHAPHERAGSRLAASAAAAGGGGGAGDDTAATPGGLSARPSQQSLPGLASTAGPGGVAGAAGAAQAALQHQTAERRRLDLDALGSPANVLTSAGMRRQQQLAVSSSGGEEEEEASEGVAGGRRARYGGGAGGDDEPSSAPPSSGLAAGDSLAGGQGAGSAINLAYAASVDLINAPIQEIEPEQAELL